MDFVKIRGKDMQDCLMQMKMKYGPEAHVYDHKVVREGGVMGFFGNEYCEIEVGIPEKKSSRENDDRKIQNLRELLKQKSEEKKAAPLKTLKPLADITSALENGAEHLNTSIGLSLQEEIVRKKTYPEPVAAQEAVSSAFASLAGRLVEEGMSKGYVDELVKKVESHLPAVDKNRTGAVLEKTAEILEDRVRVDSNLLSGAGRKKKKVIFFTGPTGSGKTTTIAKLAAKYHLHMGKSVSLYTTDHYRIAAVEQLKRYADTMDIPFHAVKDPDRFREALDRDGSELVFVDTAGYSHKNPELFDRMRGFMSVIGNNEMTENILVIPATSSYHNARAVMNAYETLDYERIILTKVDEAEFLGGFLELADINSRAFAYYGVGQEVPFDILPADSRQLAEGVVNPEKIRDIRGEVFSA